MIKIFMTLLAAILITGPAVDASASYTDQTNSGENTPSIIYFLNDTVAKILNPFNICFNADNLSSPQPSEDSMTTTPHPSKDQGTATPQPSKDSVTTTPHPSKDQGTATPQPSKDSVTATPQPSMGNVTATPQPSKDSVTATAKPSPSVTKPDPSVPADSLSYEKQVAVLVNKERAAYGLAPLTLSAKLSDVARLKSQDMHDNHYFSHTSPTYGSPFNMLKTFNISYRSAGENIAMGYRTPEEVVHAWMNSSGHRANILNASYTQIGVGYVADGHYWTQTFTG